jgi:hypothetical protein
MPSNMLERGAATEYLKKIVEGLLSKGLTDALVMP